MCYGCAAAVSVSSATLMVCPALDPPWQRPTMSTDSQRTSTIFPLPSSPHCAPSTTRAPFGAAFGGIDDSERQVGKHTREGERGASARVSAATIFHFAAPKRPALWLRACIRTNMKGMPARMHPHAGANGLPAVRSGKGGAAREGSDEESQLASVWQVQSRVPRHVARAPTQGGARASVGGAGTRALGAAPFSPHLRGSLLERDPSEDGILLKSKATPTAIRGGDGLRHHLHRPGRRAHRLHAADRRVRPPRITVRVARRADRQVSATTPTPVLALRAPCPMPATRTSRPPPP